MKPIYFINFVKRYLRLIIVWIIFVVAGRFDGIVFFFGHIFYVAELALSCALGSLVIRHLFLRYTIDKYSMEINDQPSEFMNDWAKADPTLKMVLSVLVFIVLFLGTCIIAASIAK